MLALPRSDAMVWRGERHPDGDEEDSYVATDTMQADDEREDDAQRSIFAVTWFRALLVLTMLAVGVVVALPYFLDWFEPPTQAVKAPGSARTEPRTVSTPRPAP